MYICMFEATTWRWRWQLLSQICDPLSTFWLRGGEEWRGKENRNLVHRPLTRFRVSIDFIRNLEIYDIGIVFKEKIGIASLYI